VQLTERIEDRIRREGPITFADYMALALDDPHDGFFVSGGAGRAGRDFVTSPEVGTLFGALVARAIDRVWERLGRPDPFVVIEAGAGRGRLAADVLRAQPACAPALRYVLVESSPTLRAEQRDLLTLEPADEALGPSARSADPGEPPELLTGTGPIATTLDDLPAVHVDGVVLANELLDNLPAHIVERADDGWSEVRIALPDDDAGRFTESLVPASPELAAEVDDVVGDTAVPPGARLPVPTAVRDWLARVASVLRRGDVIVLDYADDAAGLLARGPAGWLRTYRAHTRGTDPLEAPGTQDITYDLPLEYVRAVAQRAGLSVASESSQADWLRELGSDELAEAGAATWRERAHLGDLEAIAGRSRVTEAAALVDPAGLGAHRVLTFARLVR
jgi:NADH dehydrogenase [ubiquinone] 1 alpha subcomplex assembly factor 7